MGKLVLHLPDGSVHDIRLDKQRLTIGRRADNDVCLPYPAVSAEHAAVVTILADSFLEDLNSTNGTLVNGQPVTKHFLRDNDHIDIGRQRLVYFSDEHARPAPLPPDVLLRDLHGLREQVERVRSRRSDAARTAPAPVHALADGEVMRADRESRAAPFFEAALHPDAQLEQADGGEGAAVATVDMPVAPPQVDTVIAPLAAGQGDAAAWVRVLTGTSAGREVAITDAAFCLGQVGRQVARLERRDDDWHLVPIEGPEPLLLNGATVPDSGQRIEPGDRFLVAGAELAFEQR